MKKTRIIFLCIGNSARSQMAEAFLRRLAGDYFEVYSAGFEEKPIHPLTYKVMAELGYDLSGQSSKNLKQYLGKIHFGIIITVCDRAEKVCPIFPGTSTRLYWPFEDPAAYEGSEQDRLQKFREIRNQIQARVKLFLKERKIPFAP